VSVPTYAQFVGLLKNLFFSKSTVEYGSIIRRLAFRGPKTKPAASGDSNAAATGPIGPIWHSL
jgi:hypothetical protein